MRYRFFCESDQLCQIQHRWHALEPVWDYTAHGAHLGLVQDVHCIQQPLQLIQDPCCIRCPPHSSQGGCHMWHVSWTDGDEHCVWHGFRSSWGRCMHSVQHVGLWTQGQHLGAGWWGSAGKICWTVLNDARESHHENMSSPFIPNLLAPNAEKCNEISPGRTQHHLGCMSQACSWYWH